MNHFKFFLIAVLCYFALGTETATSPTCNGRSSSRLTRASDTERLRINQLIKKIDFDSAARNQRISTYATYSGFRLDNEQPTGDYAKFRIQSGKKTYGDVLIKIGKYFGKRKIRNLFIKSVYCGQIFELR